MELTYYLYDPKTFMPTNAVKADKQPENSSQFPPPECAPTQQVYFNGHGWVKSFRREDMTAERIRSVLKAIAAFAFDRDMRSLNAGRSLQEVSMYQQQYTEAKEYQKTGKPPLFLQLLSEARGEECDELAQKIIDKAEAYAQHQATALATYQAAVKDAETRTDLVLTQEMLRHPLLMQV
jgi:hypothetical protein